MNLNWPYLHILINHFPIILSVVGCAALALGLMTRNRVVWLYALATLTLAGLSIYPVFFTGDQAAHALRDTWYVVRAMVKEHDDAAGYALPVMLMTGAVSGYTWWRMLRREVSGLPPVWLRTVVVLVSFFSLSVVVRTAYLGGKIIHDSPKLQTPPASPPVSGGTAALAAPVDRRLIARLR